VQPRRARPEVLQLGDGLEVAQVPQIHCKSAVYESEESIDWTIRRPQPILAPRPSARRRRGAHGPERRHHAPHPTRHPRAGRRRPRR
jgi:hypothetical protein